MALKTQAATCSERERGIKCPLAALANKKKNEEEVGESQIFFSNLDETESPSPG